jgi:hypothetical protein
MDIQIMLETRRRQKKQTYICEVYDVLKTKLEALKT